MGPAASSAAAAPAVPEPLATEEEAFFFVADPPAAPLHPAWGRRYETIMASVQELADARRLDAADLGRTRIILHEFINHINHMLVDLIVIPPPPPPPAEEAATEDEEEEEAESDGAAWQLVIDAFMGTEGRVCLTTYIGGHVGGYAADIRGNLYKCREER